MEGKKEEKKEEKREEKKTIVIRGWKLGALVGTYAVTMFALGVVVGIGLSGGE